MATVTAAAIAREEQIRAYLVRRAAEGCAPANTTLVRRPPSQSGPLSDEQRQIRLHAEVAPEARRTARPPTLRDASFADHAQIALLESRYGLVTRSYDEWSHLWLGNPLYRELRARWRIGWVLEDESERIVGWMANIPLSYEFEGRRVLVASGSNWVAEPAYRSASLLLLDRVINQRDADLYVNSTVGVASAAALSTFGCTRVPVGRWDTSVYWITHYRSVFESRLVRKHCPFAKPLGYALSAAVFLRDRLMTTALREGDVEVRGYPGFDERFDAFWVDVKQKNPHVLLAVRSRETLEWHYKHALLNGRLWIAAVVDGPRLAAYATFHRADKPLWGTRVRLVDFQSLDGTTALLPPVLSWALRKCRDEGIQTLEIVGRWLEKGDPIETLAPYRQALPTWRYVYRARDSRLAASLRNPRAWAPSLFDGDASL